MERFARHALFEDLQRGWSDRDARFVAERSGLEDQDVVVEDGQRDGQVRRSGSSSARTAWRASTLPTPESA